MGKIFTEITLTREKKGLYYGIRERYDASHTLRHSSAVE